MDEHDRCLYPDREAKIDSMLPRAAFYQTIGGLLFIIAAICTYGFSKLSAIETSLISLKIDAAVLLEKAKNAEKERAEFEQRFRRMDSQREFDEYQEDRGKFSDQGKPVPPTRERKT